MSNFNFKTKFIILLLLVSLLPTIFIGIFSYEISKSTIYERIELDLATQAENLMGQIDRFLYERHNDTQLIISDSTLISNDASATQKTTILKEYLINLGLYENIHLLNLEGDIIASTYSSEAYPNISGEKWFIDTKKIFYYTSDIQFSPFTGKPTIIFSNIILDAENKPTGIIVAELIWPVILEFLDNVPESTHAILLNENNIEIGGGEPENILRKDWSEQGKNNFKNNQFLTNRYISRGSLVYKGNNWKLLLRVPVEKALAPLNQLFYLMGLTLLGVIIIITITGVTFGNRLVGPIRKLTLGAQEIQKGNLNQKIIVKTKDEIGFLAETFNNMAVSLKEKQTKLKQSIKKEVELEKTKDEIWTTASHKLRTPLTGISWSLEMLTSGILGPLNKKQRDTVNQLNKNTAHLNFLINILLNTAKLEDGKIKLTKSEFYLEEILQKAIDRKKIEIKEKQITVEKPNFRKKQIKLNLDPDKTQQVFNVLLDNAVIYSNQKGEITINIKKTKKKVLCEVTDTGIGISKKDIKNIFNKFTKGENSEIKNVQGIGLGLYLAKIIVESSKGKIWVESELKKGSTFYVELPLA